LLTFDTDPKDLPLSAPIVVQGTIATFLGQFDVIKQQDLGIVSDDEFLESLNLGECEYGAASCPIYPFMCKLDMEGAPLTARHILTAVKARQFRSQHIMSLDATYIPFPGYHPGTENDEIHNDFREQFVFPHEEDVDEFMGTHGVLKRYVADQRLWYVLLHTTPHEYKGYWFSDQVILFVIGKSPRGNRCVGVVTHQRCHNLCD